MSQTNVIFCDNCNNIMYPSVVNDELKHICKICFNEKTNPENHIFYSKNMTTEKSHFAKSQDIIYDFTLKRIRKYMGGSIREFVLILDSNMRQILIDTETNEYYYDGTFELVEKSRN